ncbi:MAG: phage portal protein [Lachnospiraceae bacterium]|nr:phage portal protein [Lachnospiraceae bacterium]
MNLNEYIQKQYNNDPMWFELEVNQGNHAARIAGVIANRDYLAGKHNVLLRENSQYKGKQFVTRKTILNYAKTVIRFHDTYLLGKPVQLSCSDDETARLYTEIHKLGQYDTTDYEILDRVNKFGDAYEVVYMDGGTIRSKVLDSACCYPVYDDNGNYISFVEHWTDVYTGISYYNVYYPGYVQHWSNEGGDEHLTGTDSSVGLPIHYHNFSDMDYNFGESILTDIKPIMDDLEDIMSKLGDSIYVNVLGAIPVATGQYIQSSIPADAVGYVLNLDNGTFEYANCQLDYQTIKLYLDNLKQMLNDIACIPSVLGSSTNIANVSSISMQILMMMANLNADETKKWLNLGFAQRFAQWQQILALQGIKSVASGVQVIYNISQPVERTEMIDNLAALRDLGAISTETIMEKSDIVSDVDVEKERLAHEQQNE